MRLPPNRRGTWRTVRVAVVNAVSLTVACCGLSADASAQANTFSGSVWLVTHTGTGLGNGISAVVPSALPLDGSPTQFVSQHMGSTISAEARRWSDGATFDRVLIAFATTLPAVNTQVSAGAQSLWGAQIALVVPAGVRRVLHVRAAQQVTSGHLPLNQTFGLYLGAGGIPLFLATGTGPSLSFQSYSVLASGTYSLISGQGHGGMGSVNFHPTSEGVLSLELLPLVGLHAGGACAKAAPPSIEVAGVADPGQSLHVAVSNAPPSKKVYLAVGTKTGTTDIASTCALLIDASALSWLGPMAPAATGGLAGTTGFQYRVATDAPLGSAVVFQVVVVDEIAVGTQTSGSGPTPGTELPWAGAGSAIATSDAVVVTI